MQCRHQAARRALWLAGTLLIGLLWLLPQSALAALTTTVDGDTLTVVSDAGDAVVIACVDGLVEVNAALPGDAAVECATLAHLHVEGGPGDNTIDAGGVLTPDFPALTAVILLGRGGNDVITGTLLADTLQGGPGDDTLVGFKGDDAMSGGPGDDHLVWNNGDNSDTLEGDDGYDVVQVRGAVDKGDVFIVTPIGGRAVFTRTNLIAFTLDIGSAEQLAVERGEPADSFQVTPVDYMVVTVNGVTPPAAAAVPVPPMVIVGAGNISNTVAAYQLLLGGQNNGGEPGARPDGFRTINWDGVPDDQSAPNGYDPAFFNQPTAPLARGAVFATPGDGLQISADADNPTNTPVRFGHINPTYTDIFKTFSAEKLFSPVGSNIADIFFFVPGSDTPAVTRGFGAVYTDIDTAHTAFEYFDLDGNSLGAYQAPVANEGLSFLGAIFPEPVVHRVRITYGTAALGPDDGPAADVAVMDDFIYGEPQPAPVSAPAAAGLPAGVAADAALIAAAAPDTPDGSGYATGLAGQAELAYTHAELALNALLAGDLAGGRNHGEHVWNILHGEASGAYGDVNEDGEIQNPGDGYGVIAYAAEIAEVADRIAENPEATGPARDAALALGVCARSLATVWVAEAKVSVLGVLEAANSNAATAPAQAAAASLAALVNGLDANGDGAVQLVRGECGVLQLRKLVDANFPAP